MDDGLSTGLPLLLVLLVGINVSLATILRTQRRADRARPGRVRREG